MNKAPTAILLLAACICLTTCNLKSNYLDAFQPRFEGDYSDTSARLNQPDFDGTIKVVSYNIKFGQDIDRAIDELSGSTELEDADIILLQEMDEAGTQAIAQALGHNFVYYPASVHNRHARNFGNAILSKWPIDAPEKIILPHRSPTTQEIRIAVKAVVTIEDMQILTYSVHSETFLLGSEKKQDQVDTLIENIDTSFQNIVVGGDFNTLTPESIKDLENGFAEIGIERATKGIGNTVRYRPLELALDHIFTKGMSVIEAGESGQAKASDHLPIWTNLMPGDVP